MKIQFLFIFAVLNLALGFPDDMLKNCNQAGFCSRNRHYAKAIQVTQNTYYHIDEKSLKYDQNSNEIKANLIKMVPNSKFGITLPIKLGFIDSQNGKDQSYLRLRIDENRPKSAGTKLLRANRYSETDLWSFDPNKEWKFGKATLEKKKTAEGTEYVFFPDNNQDLKVKLNGQPFKIEVYKNEDLVFTANENQFLNIEHYRTEKDCQKSLLPEESDFDMFKDHFEYSVDDTLPLGPESIAMDLEFKKSKAVYGIPEHADSLKLKDTTEADPYRLYNVDVFKYHLNSTTPTYGAIPFMFATNHKYTTGVFWVNSADTWIDINYNDAGVRSHWMSENGVLDVVVFLGDSPADVLDQFTDLTGKPFLPLQSTIGYHQCRWNYNTEHDVLTVQNEMDKAHIPFDVIWLDLEYTHDRKYFTWKESSFPNPKRLLEKLSPLARQLVVLIDPHLKSEGNNISDTIVKEKAAINDNAGKIYIGDCWPGETIWIDTLGKVGQKVWKSFFDTFFYKDATNLQIWNDMNEPSMFNGPETTAPKDLIHADGYEERSVHNVYGLTVHETTFKARTEFYEDERLRPFILTRSFFAGSQRTAATWTGDNVANWDYLKISIPMCLTNNVAGFPFIGADVAGFAGDPEEKLVARWYQVGLWYPFFRAHAHIDAARREPYLYKGETRKIIKDSIRLRYKLLPTFYTMFYESSVNGSPIMKPMFFDYYKEDSLAHIDDQFFVGSSGILVKPITDEDVYETEVVFPPKLYYDLNTFDLISDNLGSVSVKRVAAPLDTIPMYLEGGHIIFLKELYRRSSSLMKNDPYTVIIAPDENGNAFGTLYIDDGNSLKHEDGQKYKFVVKMENYVVSITPEITPKNEEYFGNSIINKFRILQNNYMKEFNTVTVHNKENEEVHVAQLGNEDRVFTLDIACDMKQDTKLALEFKNEARSLMDKLGQKFFQN